MSFVRYIITYLYKQDDSTFFVYRGEIGERHLAVNMEERTDNRVHLNYI